MSEPFLAEIRPFAFGFVPKGWLACAGQTLPINQNQALFSLLGTTYGGDGFQTFQLPDLRGRTAVHSGTTVTLGEKGGEESHTLTPSETPRHGFAVDVKSSTRQPAGAAAARGEHYGTATGTTDLVGGGQPHENRPPYLAVELCIAVQGIFPSRS
jgi:microcystin-dependent protein